MERAGHVISACASHWLAPPGRNALTQRQSSHLTSLPERTTETPEQKNLDAKSQHTIKFDKSKMDDDTTTTKTKTRFFCIDHSGSALHNANVHQTQHYSRNTYFRVNNTASSVLFCCVSGMHFVFLINNATQSPRYLFGKKRARFATKIVGASNVHLQNQNEFVLKTARL